MSDSIKHLDKEDIERLLDGEMPPHQQREWIQHIAFCDQCGHLLMSLPFGEKQMIATLSSGNRKEVPVRWMNGSSCPSEDDLWLLAEGKLPAARCQEIDQHLDMCDYCLDCVLWNHHLRISGGDIPLEGQDDIPHRVVSGGTPAILKLMARVGDGIIELISQTGQVIQQYPVFVRGTKPSLSISPSIKVRRDIAGEDMSIQVTLAAAPSGKGIAVECSFIRLSNSQPIPGLRVRLEQESRVLQVAESSAAGVASFSVTDPISLQCVITPASSNEAVLRVEIDLLI